MVHDQPFLAPCFVHNGEAVNFYRDDGSFLSCKWFTRTGIYSLTAHIHLPVTISFGIMNLQYVNGVITKDPFVQEIHQEVHEIKQNEKWRDEYMFMADKIRFIQQEAIEEGIQKGIATGMQKGLATGMQKGLATGMQKGMATGMQKGMATGMQKGRADSQKEIIANMLKQQLNCAQISKLTGLAEKDVQTMAQELKVQ